MTKSTTKKPVKSKDAVGSEAVTLKQVLLHYVRDAKKIDGLQAKIEGFTVSLSQEMLTVAKTFYTGTDKRIDVIARGKTENLPTDLIAFLDACKHEEEAFKASGKNRVIPRNYSQLKSNLKNAWSKGLNIKEYSKESDLRDALNTHRKASSVATSEQNDRDSVSTEAAIDSLTKETIDTNTVVELVSSQDDDSSINALVGNLLELSSSLSDKEAKALEHDIGGVVLKYRAILAQVLPEQPVAPSQTVATMQ